MIKKKPAKKTTVKAKPARNASVAGGPKKKQVKPKKVQKPKKVSSIKKKTRKRVVQKTEPTPLSDDAVSNLLQKGRLRGFLTETEIMDTFLK